MSRTRASAKAAGTRHERGVADYLADRLDDDGIDRQVKMGSRDVGDIRGVKIHGQRIAIEAKNTSRMDLAGWLREAEVERGNLDGIAGVVVAKRHGKSDPAESVVLMTLRDFAAMVSGRRDPE